MRQDRKGTPQPKETFYLLKPRPEFATTGEAPFFSMAADKPDTSKSSFGTPWNKHER